MRYDFGKVYKEIRESKGLTQEEVCSVVVFSQKPVYQRLKVARQPQNFPKFRLFHRKSI